MPIFETIHVLDPDVRRRASIARQIHGFGHHAELYDGIDEISARPPSSGLLLVFDDRAEPVLPMVVEIIKETGRYLSVALYSNDIRPERIVSAMTTGALDYLHWPFDPAKFEQSLNRLGQLGKSLESRKRKVASARHVVEKLSGREREVLRALVSGASSKEIGKALGISPRTVEIHRANLMKKLNASNTVDAVRIGLFAGEDSWLADSHALPN